MTRMEDVPGSGKVPAFYKKVGIISLKEKATVGGRIAAKKTGDGNSTPELHNPPAHKQ